MQQLSLTEYWQLKQRDQARALEDDRASSDDWLAATVPGVVHQDLLTQGVIPDPLHGMNEEKVQWVGENDWLYRCQFSLPTFAATPGTTVLCFDGLDTIATVWLNGTKILTSENMFVAHRIVIDSYLQSGQNELIILFESVLRYGKEREAALGKLMAWNGDSSRVYVRKAQYHYGWDWGPCILTAGPWLPVRLEHYVARIADIHCPVVVAEDLKSAQLPVQLEIELCEPLSDVTATLALYDPDGELIEQMQSSVTSSMLASTFVLHDPKLWWPHGYGTQPLYRLAITLEQHGTLLDRREQTIGIRHLRLIQEPVDGEDGTTFRFEVNAVPIFCKGANWIPSDLLLPRVTTERYRAHLQRAVDANMMMLRVWGGGIYESDTFYDLCDKLGILIWQDFMFACGVYPAHQEFLDNVRSEAESAVRRLRHHPCLALWCGNNEDYMLAGSINIPIHGAIGSEFPARAIYERLLPEMCAALDPIRPYWPGSPYAGEQSNDALKGDRHTWEIWHGSMAPYQDYPRYAGRFVSEFGMEALPQPATVAEFGPSAMRYPGGQALDYHNKADNGTLRLMKYLCENVRVPADLDRFIYATQLIQAEALTIAVTNWRKLFGGPGAYRCSGALIWQLNDCWPAISWSIIDDALRPKGAYYAVRRAFAPVALAARRNEHNDVSIWATNDTGEHIQARLHISSWGLDGTLAGEEHRTITALPYQSTELGTTSILVDDEHVLNMRLVQDTTVVARATLWPEPLRYLTLRDPAIHVEPLSTGEVHIRADYPARGVYLNASDTVEWDDNFFDLFPDESRTIGVKGAIEGPIEVRSLFDLQ
jgi:beta-mannosidase